MIIPGMPLMMGRKLRIPWDISGAVYNGKSFYVGGQVSNPRDIIIRYSGDTTLNMQILDAGGYLREYSMTPDHSGAGAGGMGKGDVTTCSYLGSATLTDFGTNLGGLAWADNTARIFIAIDITNDRARRNNNSRTYRTLQPGAYSYDQTAALSSPNGNGSAIHLASLGGGNARMYLTNGSGVSAYVYQHDCTNGFQLSGAGDDLALSKTLNVGATTGNNVLAIRLSPDGSKMYLLGYDNDTVYQFDLNIPYEIDSAAYNGVSFYVGSQVSLPVGLEFSGDGREMYVLGGLSGTGEKTVFQYNLA